MRQRRVRRHVLPARKGFAPLAHLGVQRKGTLLGAFTQARSGSTACRGPRRPRSSSRARSAPEERATLSATVAGYQLADLPRELRESWHRALGSDAPYAMDPFLRPAQDSPMDALTCRRLCNRVTHSAA